MIGFAFIFIVNTSTQHSLERNVDNGMLYAKGKGII